MLGTPDMEPMLEHVDVPVEGDMDFMGAAPDVRVSEVCGCNSPCIGVTPVISLEKDVCVCVCVCVCVAFVNG